MEDADVRNRLEGIVHELYNLVGHKADDSPIWQYIDDLAAAFKDPPLEAPVLAEVEAYIARVLLEVYPRHVAEAVFYGIPTDEEARELVPITVTIRRR